MNTEKGGSVFDFIIIMIVISSVSSFFFDILDGNKKEEPKKKQTSTVEKCIDYKNVIIDMKTEDEKKKNFILSQEKKLDSCKNEIDSLRMEIVKLRTTDNSSSYYD